MVRDLLIGRGLRSCFDGFQGTDRAIEFPEAANALEMPAYGPQSAPSLPATGHDVSSRAQKGALNFPSAQTAVFSIKRTLAIFWSLLSGGSGLIYEPVWLRKASSVFGATTWAPSRLSAVFFLGWVIGSCMLSRLSSCSKRPIRAYAPLEVALALVALWCPRPITQLDSLYGHA